MTQTIRDQIAAELENYAVGGILPFLAEVQTREEGAWVSQASGSSVAWLADAADDEADFAPVRVVGRIGNGHVIAGEGALNTEATR